MKANPTYLTPSYEDIHQACIEFVEVMDHRVNFKFDRIVGVSRGGLLPALILSHHLELPLSVVQYSSKNGKGDDKNYSNILPVIEVKRILIVDDICDSGYTLREIVDYYTAKGHIVHTAVLFFKDHKEPVIVPDISWRTIPSNSGWVVFPFENSSSD